MTTLAAPYQRTAPTSAIDHRRGSQAMVMFIVTEAMLFLMLFFAYFYLAHDAPRWPTELPKITKALIMLAILLASSVVLHFGEAAATRAHFGQAKLWTALTLVMGVVFVAIQVSEYREHLETLRPTTNAYGSIFYTITSFHAAHLVLGMLMLLYVLILPGPHLGKADKPPHDCLHNTALYWHFVDAVWLVVVAVLYIAPRFTGQ